MKQLSTALFLLILLLSQGCVTSLASEHFTSTPPTLKKLEKAEVLDGELFLYGEFSISGGSRGGRGKVSFDSTPPTLELLPNDEPFRAAESVKIYRYYAEKPEDYDDLREQCELGHIPGSTSDPAVSSGIRVCAICAAQYPNAELLAALLKFPGDADSACRLLEIPASADSRPYRSTTDLVCFAVVLPITVAFDVVTSPIQFFYVLYGMKM